MVKVVRKNEDGNIVTYYYYLSDNEDTEDYGVISINMITGEISDVKAAPSDSTFYSGGHALHVIENFYENKDFKEVGYEQWV